MYIRCLSNLYHRVIDEVSWVAGRGEVGGWVGLVLISNHRGCFICFFSWCVCGWIVFYLLRCVVRARLALDAWVARDRAEKRQMTQTQGWVGSLIVCGL